ncbi:MAG: hypothetical protein M5U34_31195 [Chloroflexi bacterium]|nr:hypothetical protein [Chloroflexota bacterium]
MVGWGISGVISPEMLDSVQAWLPVPDKAEWRIWHKQIAAWHGEAQVRPMIEGWVNAATAIKAQGGNVLLPGGGAGAMPRPAHQRRWRSGQYPA